MRNKILSMILSISLHLSISSLAQEVKDNFPLELNATTADHFAGLAMGCIKKPFPYKSGHVIQHATDNDLPVKMHPSFYGCFDWHSSVHGHWMLVRLLRLYPESSVAVEIRALLNRQLTVDKLLAETK